MLMDKNETMETDKYMTKEQKILFMDISQALRKYHKFADIPGKVLINAVKIEHSDRIDGWQEMSFWFKIER